MPRQARPGIAKNTPQRDAAEAAILLGREQERSGLLRRPLDAGVPPAEPLWEFPPGRSCLLVRDYAYEHVVAGFACRRADGSIMIHWGVPWLENDGRWHMANPATTERWVGPAQVIHPDALGCAGTVRIISDDQPWVDKCSEYWEDPRL